MKRILLTTLGVSVLVLALAILSVRLRYGRGELSDDRSSEPLLHIGVVE